MRRIYRVLLLLPFLIACNQAKKDTVFTIVADSNIDFVNKLTESDQFNVFKYRNFYNGGGVATGDLNNDGLPEIFFTANQGPNKLYLNKGQLKFEDITEKAGITFHDEWSTGVVLVDINNDGWLDIYVCNAGNMTNKALRKNQLYINNHNLTFTEKAAAYGLDNDGYTTHASFFDYDLDGDLDCFLVNNSPIPVNTLNYANMRNVPEAEAPFAEFLKGGGDHLFRNDNGRYVEVTKEAGIYGSIISFGLGVTVGDVNNDGYPDIYVSNDFFEKDYLYINQRNGTFRDEVENRTQHISFSSMGADMQDINNDGRPDIFTTDMLPDNDYRLKTNTSFEGYEVFKLKQDQGFFNQYTQNALLVNNGQGNFQETAFYSGVAASDWSWGALIFDADNDGMNDILVCNGIYRDVTDQDFIDFFANDVVNQMVLKGKKEEVNNVIDKMPSVPVPNKLFRNTGNLKFEDVGMQWGLDKPTFSNGAAYADLDNDGDLDLVINNVNQQALIYQNHTRETNPVSTYIAVTVQYKDQNIFGIGSIVKVFLPGDTILTREIMPSRGFQSCVEYRQTIGLGHAAPDSIQVIWPNNTSQTIVKPKVNQLNRIQYNAAATKPYIRTMVSPEETLLTMEPVSFEKHQEDDVVDFYQERNIPFMLSKQGPKSAVADVNGDGRPDVFIGGTPAKPGQLYLQTAGGMVRKQSPDIDRFLFNDVTATFFFDADKDGDQDLFVGGGGNFKPATADVYQNQLYLNDGKGNFTLQSGAFPISHTNCGTAIPVDYDGDGLMDVFIGSRSVPQQYGVMPPSFLYHNDGNGKFRDVTATVAPFLKELGMLTSSAWADLNGDGKPELIIAGEWMSPKTYQFNGQSFSELANGLENEKGWWQTIQVADLNGDGFPDLVLGNLGQNFYLRPESKKPVKLWVNDFDNNGTMDKMFSQTIAGKDMPVFLKKDITDQVPSLKKSNLKHADFAPKTMEELFKDGLKTARMYMVNNAATSIAWNDGKGKFRLEALPYQAQLSSVEAISCTDVNGDGKPDLVLAGNFFDLLPQFCSIDASYGQVWLNKGGGKFTVLSSEESGLWIKGQVRDIAALRYRNQHGLLFLQNNQVPVYYQLNHIKH
jgi:hypothetical protein